MNDKRRAAIRALFHRVTELRAELETVRDEEQDYYDNMPDSFRDGEKGDKAQEAVDALDEAVNGLENVESVLEEFGS